MAKYDEAQRNFETSFAGAPPRDDFDDDGRVKRNGYFSLVVVVFFFLDLLHSFLIYEHVHDEAYIYIYTVCRDAVDCECAYHHGGDRIGSALAGVGDGAVGVDRGADCSHLVLAHHLVLLQPARRLLQVSSRQKKLQLQRCCQIQSRAVRKSNCFHRNGHDADCESSTTVDMVIFACIQLVLSQLPNFHKLWWLSILAAVMSVTYSSIGLGLSIDRIAGSGHARTSLTGVEVGVDVSSSDKVWRTFQSLGNIAFAYSYSNVLIEIQDTLKSSPPENKVMKKASTIGVCVTTLFYMACGVLGYAAFGNKAPGNFLTGFGFYDPYWLVDIGNICIAVHLFGAYQVFAQPMFHFFETWIRERRPNSRFITSERVFNVPFLGECPLSVFRLVWRSAYVILTAVLAMIFPFFNDILGLIGAVAFWPLTVFFPVEMYIAQAKIKSNSGTGIWLRILSVVCLLVSLVAACGSVQGLTVSLRRYKPFEAS
ncbi:hypothetical protein Cni_G08287 [Canna indica]|uniref:Amino acid transporter transmembrane domain-containing protein n=1 Tax=Canna indica TaxID=4628 RepID=A0AAQ3K5K1_9LILI|nr:hypothetical protein Cni_G08287 [Canna indica]